MYVYAKPKDDVRLYSTMILLKAHSRAHSTSGAEVQSELPLSVNAVFE